jgi:hypothetical protein
VSPTTYRFRHSCTVAAELDLVHDTLVDLAMYPTWWPQVRAVASLDPETALVVCRSALPYDLELILGAVSTDPGLLEVSIDGPIHGYARWKLTAVDGGTQLDYEQTVQTKGRLLALASYAVKPVLSWNHAVMMRGCEKGLNTLLG